MRIAALFLLTLALTPVHANPPVASYIFPAGGQRGKTVPLRVGGLFLHEKCGFEMLGPGIRADAHLVRTETTWIEGPLLPLPDSQRGEDYPKDMAGKVEIAADAPLGLRHWRLWTAQGATSSMKFMVGDLPEMVEEEIAGDPIPVAVGLPLTINGRIFPREDMDVYSFTAKKGQAILCEVHAARLGSPLDARLEVLDSRGRRLAENSGPAPDPRLRFIAPADGEYRVRIHDIRMLGGQQFVYRLTVTADPHVDSVYPLGGKRGSTLRLFLQGQEMPPSPVEVSLPASAAESHTVRIEVAGKKTNSIALDVDDLPEHLEAEPNDATEKAAPLGVPAVFNGRIDKPGDLDWWAFAARKGEAFEVELRAGQLGSGLFGVLRVCDAAGKELVKAQTGPGKIDAVLRFVAPADGQYRVAVADRFSSRCGPSYGYRLRIAPPREPDFQLWLAADAVTVPRGGEGKLKVVVERIGGFKGAITLSIGDLPPGVKLMNPLIAASQSALDLKFKSDDSAAIQPSRLRIVGTAEIGTKSVDRIAGVQGFPELTRVMLAVSLPAPFAIKGEYDMGFAARGAVHERKYRIERKDYEGPIEIRLADRQARHLQGVTGPTIIVPAGKSEFTYAVTLPPWMDLGRTCRVCVMGVGTVKEADGTEHRVSFSSVNQNEQFVAVVGPGKLALELERSSLIVQPGKAAALKVRIQRATDVVGKVKIELIAPAHLRALRADTVEIPADGVEARLSIEAASTLRGPINMPLTVRATSMHLGRPIVAEAALDVQAAN